MQNNFTGSRVQLIEQEIAWLDSLQTASGAIRNSLKYAQINPNRYMTIPYFANYAAMALTRDLSKLSKVKKYMEWYLAHLNWPDKRKVRGKKIYGTIDDYYITENGTEISTNNYDSADSYAATFISLAKTYFEASRDAEFFAVNKEKIKAICDVMVNLKQGDALTWAKPDHKVKYLMDNCEVYKGLMDAAFLWENVLSDHCLADYYHRQGEEVRTAILKNLRHRDEFYPKKICMFRFAAKWDRWYPDVACQLYPIIFGILPPDHACSKKIYKKVVDNVKVNKNCDWINLQAGKDYPWVIAGYASVVMNDKENAEKFYENITKKFIRKENDPNNFWNSFEAAWFVFKAEKM